VQVEVEAQHGAARARQVLRGDLGQHALQQQRGIAPRRPVRPRRGRDTDQGGGEVEGARADAAAMLGPQPWRQAAERVAGPGLRPLAPGRPGFRDSLGVGRGGEGGRGACRHIGRRGGGDGGKAADEIGDAAGRGGRQIRQVLRHLARSPFIPQDAPAAIGGLFDPALRCEFHQPPSHILARDPGDPGDAVGVHRIALRRKPR
jgi:hypothetical protein